MHIATILNEKRFSELTPAELTQISGHCAVCPDCASEFTAARIASELLFARAAAEVAPSPFFEARVLNALRERQMVRRPLLAFRRWWQASYGLVGAMVLLVVMFVGLTVFAPGSEGGEVQAEVSNFNLYSTDSVIIRDRMSRDLTAEQALEVIYTERRDTRKK